MNGLEGVMSAGYYGYAVVAYGSKNEVHFYCMQIVYYPHQTTSHGNYIVYELTSICTLFGMKHQYDLLVLVTYVSTPSRQSIQHLAQDSCIINNRKTVIRQALLSQLTKQI